MKNNLYITRSTDIVIPLTAMRVLPVFAYIGCLCGIKIDPSYQSRFSSLQMGKRYYIPRDDPDKYATSLADFSR